jgi:hypothetical protein
MGGIGIAAMPHSKLRIALASCLKSDGPLASLCRSVTAEVVGYRVRPFR